MGVCMRFCAMGILGGAVIGLTLLAGTQPGHAEAVGLVQRLQNTVYGTPPAATRVPKYRRDGIEYRELLETARSSAVEIGFVDGSDLTIGAEASVLIDQFVYDQESSTGSAVLTLTQGAFRWITGVMPAGSVRFETPTATISIRGTNVKVAVKANGDSLLAIDDGEVTVIPKGKGEATHLIKGQSARVTASGIEVLDQILPVVDPIVDGGWANATEFGNDRSNHGKDRDRSGSGGND